MEWVTRVFYCTRACGKSDVDRLHCDVILYCEFWNHKCKDEIHQSDEQEIGFERQKTANKKSSRI